MDNMDQRLQNETNLKWKFGNFAHFLNFCTSSSLVPPSHQALQFCFCEKDCSVQDKLIKERVM